MTGADPRPRLGLWLRSLWNIAPPLHLMPVADASARGFLSPQGLHLPSKRPDAPGNDARWQHAAAAHGAAHLVYSNHRFATDGLRPVSQALLGLLEDARVEWLACRELPGLRRLWADQHGAASEAVTVESLMARLARCLLDPSHIDPHPWVAKGRSLFYLDADGRMLALRQPAELRRAATLLGNDIGQMRLQVNAPTCAVQPSYRDDNQWLWERPPDAVSPEADASSASTPAALPAAAEHRHRYPEWDGRIARHREDWCQVIDSRPTRRSGEPAPAPSAADLRPLQLALRVPQHGPQRWRHRQFDGTEFDLEALIHEAVARRTGGSSEGRVHRTPGAPPASRSALLLLDASASTARALDASHPHGPSVLDLACQAALRCAAAMGRAGDACAIHAFCSEGREAVHYERLKDAAEPLDDAALARLAGLRSRWSTRLGAALRHATRLSEACPAEIKLLLLVTDGEPHDIDVHDPHYLVDDARQAVREARRRGVTPFCLCIGHAPMALQQLRRIFGPADVRSLADLAALPRALKAAALATA